MRSVRSLARIGSWAQLKNTPNPDAAAVADEPVKDKESDEKKKKKKKDKDKGKDKSKETIRYSGSSFEAGALTASPAGPKHESRSLGKKKASILGLGLPSTMRLPSSRSGSTGSSIVAADATNRYSIDSANLLGGGILVCERSGSTMSTASSLRPMSAKSRVSRESSGSSGTASVRWDEAGLQTVKEIRRKEKESKSKESKRKEEESKEKKKSKKSKIAKDSTRKLSDSRKRTPLAAIFPGTVSERGEEIAEQLSAMPDPMTEKATSDRDEFGHHKPEAVDPTTETPVKRVRSRPMSEQPLDRSRPKPLYEGDDGNIVFFQHTN